MAKRPPVAAAIKAAQAEVQKENVFGLKEAIIELDQRIAIASSAKQHSAVAKMLELKMKAHGLLVDKLDVRQQQQFHVNIVGLDERPEIHVNGAMPLQLHMPAQLTSDEDDGTGLID